VADAAFPTAEPPESEEDGHVVHLVGPVSDSVFGSIGAITAFQAEQGIGQTVILVDDPAHRHLLPRFHPSVRLVLTPSDTGPLQRVAQSLGALLSAVRAQQTAAVHLHGIIPSLLGFCAFWFKGMPRDVSFSSARSGSMTPSKRLGASGRLALVGRLPPGQQPNEAPAAAAVDAAFFSVERREARRPLLVAGSAERNPNAVALFAQLAVLLSEDTLDVSCNWHGRVSPDSQARLTAANVAVYDVPDTSTRASRLASGWVYVAFGGARGFAIDLAEAMAAGMPCVVWNTTAHRELVEHGKTALCCQSPQQLLACVAELIDSPDERHRLGQAAREEARRRFGAALQTDAQPPTGDMNAA